MSQRATHILAAALLTLFTRHAQSQSPELHGQASASVAGNTDNADAAGFGLRYIPDFLAGQAIGDGLDASMELSLNALATGSYRRNELASYDGTIKLYRGWLRISTDRFETRIGLQKISFGSALLFRPLMWFDRIDPRDPLQLTDGVYGIVSRYTFQDNLNFWLWGLYGNDETQGWELAPTEKKTAEYGGRAQAPLWSGELGVSYHHRRADIRSLLPAGAAGSSTIPEDRVGFDGKWDVGIGAWFEAALTHDETGIPDLQYQRQATVGGDYTFSVGNGLYAAAEYFRSDNPPSALGSANGLGFSGLTMNYPVGILDQLSVIVYRDWKDRQWYRIITWQRKYDNISFYLLGFWDPDTFLIYRSQGSTNAFAGTGIQILAVFNH